MRSPSLTALFLPALLAACATTPPDQSYWTSSVARYSDIWLAGELTRLLSQIEKGDLKAWRAFAAHVGHVDGEHGEVFAVACAELARRDPTFLLRRYLSGDPQAIACGRRAYGWSGCEGRSLLDHIYASRLYIAATRQERERIATFVRETTTKSKL